MIFPSTDAFVSELQKIAASTDMDKMKRENERLRKQNRNLALVAGTAGGGLVGGALGTLAEEVDVADDFDYTGKGSRVGAAVGAATGLSGAALSQYLKKRRRERKAYKEKTAGRAEATALAPFAGPLSGLAAEEDKGWQTAGGSALGAVGGGGVGAFTGYKLGKNETKKKQKKNKKGKKKVRVKVRSKKDAAALGLALGSLSGRTVGAYMGHGPNKKKRGKTKTAGLSAAVWNEINRRRS